MAYETQFNDEHALNVNTFLERPEELRQRLEIQGTLDFTPFASGLFPASQLPEEMARATEMDFSWFRDNAHVGNALYEAGRTDLAAPVAQAMLHVLNSKRRQLDGIANGTLRPDTFRLPIRVRGTTLEDDPEHRVQNDSVGYKLWYISNSITNGLIDGRKQDIETLAQTVRYLDKVRYWTDTEAGHWEEEHRIHVPSIGVCIAGLKAAQQLFDKVGYHKHTDVHNLIKRGDAAKTHILSRGVTNVPNLHDTSFIAYNTHHEAPEAIHAAPSVLNFFRQFSIDNRMYDASMLFLIEPLNILDKEETALVIDDIETHLMGSRQHGIARYVGDTYWSPNFKDIMPIEERTRSAEGRLALRNMKAAGISYTETEAQWTLFDPLLSVYWGKQYAATGDYSARHKQLLHLQRSLNQLAPDEHGSLRMPEAYYYQHTPEGGQWVPNDHMPLLWSQANLLRALTTFERTA